MSRIPMIFATALVAMTGTRALAAGVAVFSTNAVNVSQGAAEAAATVLGEAYARVAGVAVIGPRKAAVAVDKDHDLAAAARSLGVDEYLEVGTIGLWSSDLSLEESAGHAHLTTDSRIIVQAARYTADGKLVFGADMTGASMGDLEIVAVRLARALYEKKPPEDTLTIRTVTRRESIADNRTWTEKVMGLKTQVAMMLAQGQRLDPMISLGFDGRLEARSYFLELGLGLGLPADTQTRGARGIGGVYAELGGSYYLANDSVSPYIGGGVIPRIFGTSDEGGVKMAAYGQLGLMFARESSTRLYVDLRVAQNLIPYHRYRTVMVSDYYSMHPDRVDTGKTMYPTEVGLEVGIGW